MSKDAIPRKMRRDPMDRWAFSFDVDPELWNAMAARFQDPDPVKQKAAKTQLLDSIEKHKEALEEEYERWKYWHDDLAYEEYMYDLLTERAKEHGANESLWAIVPSEWKALIREDWRKDSKSQRRNRKVEWRNFPATNTNTIPPGGPSNPTTDPFEEWRLERYSPWVIAGFIPRDGELIAPVLGILPLHHPGKYERGMMYWPGRVHYHFEATETWQGAIDAYVKKGMLHNAEGAYKDTWAAVVERRIKIHTLEELRKLWYNTGAVPMLEEHPPETDTTTEPDADRKARLRDAYLEKKVETNGKRPFSQKNDFLDFAADVLLDGDYRKSTVEGTQRKKVRKILKGWRMPTQSTPGKRHDLNEWQDWLESLEVNG